MQACRAANPVEEAFLELAGGDAAARLGFAALINPGLCETDHNPAKQTQRKSRLGVTNPAMVFAQGHVQSVMEAALDDPIATFEFEKASGVQLFQREAADEINDFGSFLTFAPDPPPQPGDGLDSRKAHLLRGDFQAIQHPDFVSSPIVLPAHGVGARSGPRGKNAVG